MVRADMACWSNRAQCVPAQLISGTVAHIYTNQQHHSAPSALPILAHVSCRWFFEERDEHPRVG